AVKFIRQFDSVGTVERSETFILATSCALFPRPWHEYLTERMSSGSSVGVTTSKPSATSCLKSVTWEPDSPPTLAADGEGPDCGAGAGPGAGTFVPPALRPGPPIWCVRYVWPSKSL